MEFPLYNLLLSMQEALGNYITPQLRAVTIDIDEKEREFYPCFYFDGEVSEELTEQENELLLEVDTYTEEQYFCRDTIIRLDFPNKITPRGRFAYLRYEPVLPDFKKENRVSLRKVLLPFAVYRLDMQEALLGKVTPSLRHVSIGIDIPAQKLTTHFAYDGEISELDFNLASAAIEESKGSFSEYEIDSCIERVDFPNRIAFRGQGTAYSRHEVKFV